MIQDNDDDAFEAYTTGQLQPPQGGAAAGGGGSKNGVTSIKRRVSGFGKQQQRSANLSAKLESVRRYNSTAASKLHSAFAKHKALSALVGADANFDQQLLHTEVDSAHTDRFEVGLGRGSSVPVVDSNEAHSVLDLAFVHRDETPILLTLDLEPTKPHSLIDVALAADSKGSNAVQDSRAPFVPLSSSPCGQYGQTQLCHSFLEHAKMGEQSRQWSMPAKNSTCTCRSRGSGRNQTPA